MTIIIIKFVKNIFFLYNLYKKMVTIYMMALKTTKKLENYGIKKAHS